MRTVHLPFLLAATAGTLLLTAVPSSAGTDLMDAEISAQVDQMVETRIAEAPLVGIALAVVHEGKPILLRGYGQARLDPAEQVTPETRFQIASLSKTFAAAATMILVRQGALRLDDPVRRWLPDAPKAWEAITIRQILAHTSGIADYTGFADFLARYQQDLPRGEILREIYAQPLTHEPGQEWRYSNSGYFVLGCLLEAATGKTCGALLRETLFQPLGMERTSLMEPGDREGGAGLAVGYRLGEAGFETETYNSPSWSFLAGAVLSTARDLARWDAALDGDSFLTAEEKRMLWTPVTLPDETRTEYGLGWMLMNGPAGRHFAYHRGNKPGFSATMVRILEDRLTVVVLSNRTEGESSKLANDIGGIFFRRLLE